MINREYKYVIIGGGNAAGYACREFIKEGIKKNELCMISNETVLPYERPALSKGYMLGKAKLPGFNCCAFFKDPYTQKTYNDNGIITKLGTTVTKIDTKTKIISTNKGNSIKYGKLLTCVGCGAIKFSDFKVKGSELKGIYYMRDYNDGEILNKAVDTSIGNNIKSAVVVGGGYMGLELTSCLIQRGFTEITMIFPENNVMDLLFNGKIASYYENLYKSKGVKFMKHIKVKGFNGDNNGNVCSVILDNDNVIKSEFVFVGIGSRSNLGLFKDNNEFKIENKGLQVNKYMETTVKDVYSCGDMISFKSKYFGNKWIRLEHVRHARASAINAVKNMVKGNTSAYDFLPIFYSVVFDRKWMYYGNSHAKFIPDIKIIVFGDFKPKLLALYVDGNKIVGVFLEGCNAGDYSIAENVIKIGLTMDTSTLKESSKVDDILSILKNKCAQ